MKPAWLWVVIHMPEFGKPRLTTGVAAPLALSGKEPSVWEWGPASPPVSDTVGVIWHSGPVQVLLGSTSGLLALQLRPLHTKSPPVGFHLPSVRA